MPRSRHTRTLRDDGRTTARALILLLSLAACAGGDTPTITITDAGTSAPTTPGTTPGSATSTIATFLTIDVNALPNYASPAYPVHYDVRVRGADNSGANPVTDIGATLGRVLFHDPQLSINGTISCATCHQQADGFTDRGRFSTGFDGVRQTSAHSMRLANARFNAAPGFFWDRRAPSLESQATQPIRNEIEMGFDASVGGIDSLIRRMASLPYYPALFQLAFGDSSITEARMQVALAQFMRSLVSTGSRWDTGFAQLFQRAGPNGPPPNNVDVPGLTAQENRGRALFVQGGGGSCASCHVPPTFALDPNARGNGLDAGETTVFKSPSLKNVAVRGPYMHDGRFTSLLEVVEHYNSGVQAGAALDRRLTDRDGRSIRLNLSTADKQALVAFLGTLTDDALLTDAKFGSPFRR